MAALTYFTVVGTFTAALKDSVYDVDTDPELSPMSGTVTFTPLIDSGDSLPAVTLTPASNLFLVPIKATIRSGVITSNGATGVKLVANTAVLGLTGSLYYQVDFGDGLTAGGKTYSVRAFTFQAPTTATTVNLVEVTPAVGQPATGPVPSSAVLSVAGRTGNIVITPADVVGMEDVAHKNAANGYAGLDSNSKIALSAMPVGAMEYKGVWNASTNTPTLTDGTGTAGFLYRVGTAASRNLGSGSITWDVGDYAIHNGTTWEKSDSTDVTWGSISGQPAVIGAGTDTAAARAAIGAAKRVTYLVDDYGTVDYTGATFSDTAVDAALTAMGTAPGILQFGRGTVKLNTTKTFSRPGQAPQGLGQGLTTIDYRGTGDCFRVWDSTAVMDGAHGPSRAAPVIGMFIDLLQNANTNTCGLHIGDVFGAVVDDVVVRPASGAGSKAAWFHNTYSWFERAFVRLNVVGAPSQVGDQIVFSGDDAHPNGQTSFSYCQFYLSVDCEGPNQRGVVWTKNSQAAGIVFVLNGNFVGGASNTGTVLTVGTAPGDACLIRGHIQIMAETIGAGAVGYKDMDVSAASLVVGTGVLDFQDWGSSAFVAGTATRDTVAVAGYRHCPSLGTSDVYQPQYDTIKATNSTSVLKLQGNSSAVNYFNMTNRAAGSGPIFSTVGSDASIPIVVQPKGDAGFYTYVSNMAVSGVDFTVQGDPTNLGWNFNTQGTGRLTENGVPVLSPSGIHSATGKSTPVDADELPIVDSAASFGLKKLTWANLKAAIMAAIVGAAPATLDTLDEIAAAINDDASYAATITTALGTKAPLASPAFTGTPTGVIEPGTHAATSKATPVDADEMPFVDSAASFGLKKLTWANLKAAIKLYYNDVAAVMTNKTLTLPIVDAILDANGNYQLRFQSNASAANYLTVVNRAAGNPPYFAAAGSDANIPVAFIPKGTSGFYTYSNNVGVTAIPFVVNGDATNVGLDIQTQGTERLRVNGIIVPTVSSTDTHTNKRITPRIGTVASSATPTINTDNVDQFNVTALAAAITSMTTSLSGTPTDGQMLRIRFKDNGTARAIAWGAKFVAGPAALLTTTVISKTHFNEFVYDAAAALWVCTISHTAGY